MPGRHALLIATDTHTDPELRQLTAPAGDVRALAAVLTDPDLAGFEVDVLLNAPHHVVVERIGDFYAARRRDDLALLYFSGHGLRDDRGRLYFAATNTRWDRPGYTGVPATLVDEAMSQSLSRRKVLVLDCCYSGAFPAGVGAKGDRAVHTLDRFGGRGRVVLTASDSTQFSFEGGARVGDAVGSVFTRHLVEAVQTGAADLDGDGDVSLDELYEWVSDRVIAERPGQRPKLQQEVDGRIVISRNPNWRVPDWVDAALAGPIASTREQAVAELGRLYRIGNPLVREIVRRRVDPFRDDDSRAVSRAARTVWALGEQTEEVAPVEQVGSVEEVGSAEETSAGESGPGLEPSAEEATARPERAEPERAEPVADEPVVEEPVVVEPMVGEPGQGEEQAAEQVVVDGADAALHPAAVGWAATAALAALAALLVAVAFVPYDVATGLLTLRYPIAWWGGVVVPALALVVASRTRVFAGAALGVPLALLGSFAVFPLYFLTADSATFQPGVGYALTLGAGSGYAVLAVTALRGTTLGAGPHRVPVVPAVLVVALFVAAVVSAAVARAGAPFALVGDLVPILVVGTLGLLALDARQRRWGTWLMAAGVVGWLAVAWTVQEIASDLAPINLVQAPAMVLVVGVALLARR